MNKNIKVEVALGVIIIIAIIIGGAIWLGGKQKAEAPVTQTPKITQPELQAAPTDETAGLPSTASATEGWQTYRNEKYGFEFQYPKNNWRIGEENDAIFLDKKTINKEDLKKGIVGAGMIINLNKNEKGENIDQIISNTNKEWSDTFVYEMKEGKKIIINGIEAIENNYKGWFTVYFVNNKYIFDMSLSGDIYNDREFQKILSTFKFIN